ncbi:MAG: hypothetical protein ACKO7Y_02875 [Candidatus Nitrosotenuis sp.]
MPDEPASFDSRRLVRFQPYFIRYGEMNVLIIVIVPTIGKTNELVAPTSAPPLPQPVQTLTPQNYFVFIIMIRPDEILKNVEKKFPHQTKLV